MNVLILAAGYATRLYPLTLAKAKPLLEVAGKPMIEWVLDNLAPIPDIRTVYVVTNDKFADDFKAWADRYAKSQPKVTFKIVNDGSRSDADKLGAIGDIRLVITREDLTKEPLIVVAGDNLFSEPLADFAAQAKGSAATLATAELRQVGLSIFFCDANKDQILAIRRPARRRIACATTQLVCLTGRGRNGPDGSVVAVLLFIDGDAHKSDARAIGRNLRIADPVKGEEIFFSDVSLLRGSGTNKEN